MLLNKENKKFSNLKDKISNKENKKFSNLKDTLSSEENAQLSAEMILIMGTLLVIVILLGMYLTNISNYISESIKQVMENSRDSLINRL
ncbi:MAG: hypothetical protein LBM96_01465 [Methanobrevibacter sp.]|jgi:NADH:ubiquinone oxidoreductase subunit 4 (subunit M)|nr:hypothetical protein [Candidatus Methanoflexus mossambicus]